MKWQVVGLVTLLVAGSSGVLASRAMPGADPIYSVSQVDAVLRTHPDTLVGRVIRVRGFVGFCSVQAGCPPNTPPVLTQQLGTPSPDPPLELEYGPPSSLVATLRNVPLVGAYIPPPKHLEDGFKGVLTGQVVRQPSYACFVKLCYELVLQDMVPP